MSSLCGRCSERIAYPEYLPYKDGLQKASQYGTQNTASFLAKAKNTILPKGVF